MTNNSVNVKQMYDYMNTRVVSLPTFAKLLTSHWTPSFRLAQFCIF